MEEKMKHFDLFEVGEKSVSRGRTITETDIVLFAAFTGDWFPLHTDAEFAKKSPFGERIAHGFLSLSVASGLLPLWEMDIIAFYGMDKVRFINPVKIGDTIHVELEVVEKKEKDQKSGVITFKQSIKNQREESVAVSILNVLIAKKS
jgi:3-hydroxybutyryl-CoA dehydratase